jgi:hypothetical protein
MQNIMIKRMDRKASYRMVLFDCCLKVSRIKPDISQQSTVLTRAEASTQQPT